MIDKKLFSKCSENDIAKINNTYNFMMRTIFGYNQNEINNFTEKFNENIKKIETYPCYKKYIYRNEKGNEVIGLLEYNKDKSMNIIVPGFDEDTSKDNYFQIKTIIHEIMHAITQISIDSNKKNIDPTEYENSMMLVKTGKYIFLRDNKNSDVKENKFYNGSSLYETSNEFFTNIIINADQKNLDYYLKNNNCNDNDNFYSTFIPIIKLLSMAFCNKPNVSYDKLVKENKSIFINKSETANNKMLFTNEFISNMLINPILVEHQYDKYMGKGKFSNLIYNMQRVYNDMKYDITKEDYANVFRDMIIEIAVFNNKRCRDKYNMHEMDKSEFEQQKKNFDDTLNSTEEYYYENLYGKNIKVIETKVKIMMLTKNKD
jgi:hypothetical protein